MYIFGMFCYAVRPEETKSDSGYGKENCDSATLPVTSQNAGDDVLSQTAKNIDADVPPSNDNKMKVKDAADVTQESLADANKAVTVTNEIQTVVQEGEGKSTEVVDDHSSQQSEEREQRVIEVPKENKADLLQHLSSLPEPVLGKYWLCKTKGHI